MKKIIAIILTTIIMMFMVVACDPKPAKPSQTTEGVVSTAPDTYPVSEIVTTEPIVTETETVTDTEVESATAENVSTAETDEEIIDSDTAESDEVDERGF